MSSREIISVFANYQKARIKFVQTVADLASRPRNIKELQAHGVMDLLRPLLLDNVPSVQQSAAQALGRLASYNDELAEAVVTGEILPQLVYGLTEQNRHYKKNAAFVLRSVAKHSPRLAQAVVDSGAVESLVTCLEEFDPGVKENAVCTLGFIAKHSGELAQTIVDAGAVAPLVLCVQEPELPLKRVSASTLGEICKHSAELAQAVVEAEAIPNLVPLLESTDAKLKYQVCLCLSHIAKHSVELAEMVAEGEIFPKIFLLLKDADLTVRKNAATLIREVAKHTPELAALVVNAGGLEAIVNYVSTIKGDAKLPGVMTLGYIAAFSETMAASVIEAKAIPPLGSCLSDKESSDPLKSAAAWALGKIGSHSSKHAKDVAGGNILPKLMDAYMSNKSSKDLQNKAKSALKGIIQKCTHLDELYPLLSEKAPENILKYVVNQFAKVLPNNNDLKRQFVEFGGLAKLQLIKAKQGSELKEAIDIINGCYPPDVVQYYSPGYEKILLNKITEEN